MNMFHIRLHASTECNFHQSYLYSALYDLRKAGRIDLRWQWGSVETWAIILEVTRGRRLRVAFDFHDKSFIFSTHALETADIVFKRSYYKPDIERLPSHQQIKILPMDPVFVCRVARIPILSLLPKISLEMAKRRNLRWTRELLGNFRTLRHLTPVSQFEHPPELPLPGRILFQTRAWEDDDVTDSVTSAREINEQRAAIIRVLRKEFPVEFVGGFIPTKTSVSRYPDLVTRESSKREAYAGLLHSCIIQIYSIGLHHSIAWKLAEYLASSGCIVAEPIRNEMRHPLVEGVNYLGFSSLEGCVEACRELLRDPDRMQKMREENWAYYCRHVRPTGQIMDCLETAFSAVG